MFFIGFFQETYAKTILSFVILVLLSAGQSYGEQSRPDTGRVWGLDQTDILEYDCQPLSATRISCDFSQTMVMKDDNSPEIYENEMNSCIAEASGKNESYDENICSYVKATLALIDGQITKNEYAEQTGSSDTNFGRLLENQTNKDTFRYRLSTYAPFACAERITKEDCINVARANSEERANTCKVISNTYSQTFSKAKSTDKDIFTVESSASGPCGVINVSRFERSYNDFWDYVSQKVVTNPSGQSVLGDCSELDEQTYEYSWKPEDGVVKNCKFIKFGF